MTDLGYGYTQQKCVDMTSEFVFKLGKCAKDKPLTMKWLKGYLGRWPEMKVIKPRVLNMLEQK